MHDIELVGTTKLKAWVHYGDNFPLLVKAYENDGVTPKDLSGRSIILGIEKNNKVLGEIPAIISSNEMLFNIDYDVYSEFGIVEGEKCKFDYWDATTKETLIDKSDLEFRTVAHNTEE